MTTPNANNDSPEASRRPDGRKEHLSWEAAIARYTERPGLTENTVRTARNTLQTFYRDFVSWDITGPAGVPPRTVKRFIGRASLSQAYRLSLYSRLNAFYSWLVEEDYLSEEDSPMGAVERPEPPSSERPYLTPGEFDALTSAIRRDYEERSKAGGRRGIQEGEIIWVLPVLKLGVATGLRPSTMQEIRVGDIDLEERKLRVPGRDGADGIPERLPLCPLAVEAITEAAEGKSERDYLFSGPRSEQIDTRRLSRTVKRYLREAGIRPDLNFTDCTRHTCASWLMTLGYTTFDVGQMLGHRSLKSTEPYGHLGPTLEELRDGDLDHYEEFAEATTALGFFPPNFSTE